MTTPSFGAWLKQRRKALDLTREELAQRVGCAVSTIRKLETGARRPSRQIAERLAAQVQIPPGEREAFVQAARGVGQPAPVLDPATTFRLPAPAIRPARATLLPSWLTPLIGRAHEAAAVGLLVQRPEVRLVTLTGVGGVGKTRLAFQVAADLQHDFADGVAGVELAALSSAGLVATTIAQTLGLQEVAGPGAVTQLTNYLRDKHVLLVLDNFEHLLAAAPVVADLLRAAPRLTVLVTSRAVLHLSGEHEFPVPPLALPDPQMPLDALAENEAVRLFVVQSQAVKPTFMLTHATAPAVAEICVRLEGLPLAIQLAAARTKFFPPPLLLRRLAQRLPELTGGPRDAPRRQQTLRSTIDWSHALLGVAEQALFRRLAVFAGGATLAAAEAVCGGDDRDLDIFGGLQTLVDQSLLQVVDGPDGAPRFRMLETIREYALERLVERDEADALRARHAAYFLTLVEVVAPQQLVGKEEPQRFQQIAVEYDNLRAVLHWARERKDVVVGLQVAVALYWFWFVRSHWSEGRQWLETFLELSQVLAGTPTDAPELLRLRAQALNAVGQLARQQDDWATAAAYGAESLRLWRLLDDKHGMASALRFLGLVAPLLPERRRLIGEAMALYQEVGDTYGVAISCMNLGRNILGHGDDPAEATALLEQGLTLFRELRETTGLAWTLMGLGETAACQGHFAHASTCFAESLSLFRELGDRRRIAWVLNSLACALVNAGEVARVEPILQESLSICQELPNRLDLRGTVGEWAHLAVRQGQVTRAARLLGAAERLIEPRSAPLASLPNSWERLVEEIRAQLDAATFAAAWAEGQAMTLEQAIAYALEDDTTAD